MARLSRSEYPRSKRVRRWAVRIGVACLIVEVLYLIAGNLWIRTGALENVLDDRSEEGDRVSWASGFTLLPGLFSFKDFTYRGQSMSGQMYVHLARLDAWISLPRLAFKRIHIRGLLGRELDYRYRERIDYPCWSGEGDEPFPGVPEDLDDYPEIPGLANPPDSGPEDIDTADGESKPWRIEVAGARIRGAIRLAYNATRLAGEGAIDGAMTIVLGEEYSIDGAKVSLASATLQRGAGVLTHDLDLGLELRVAPFPGGCTETAEVIGGMSGEVTVGGRDPSGFTVDLGALQPLLPGQGVLSIESGSGVLGGRLEVNAGTVVSGDLDLVSDDVGIRYQDVPLQGDLEVHAVIREKNLKARQVDITGTTLRLDDITESGSSAKQQERLAPWFCQMEFEQGTITFATPMDLDSRVRVTMHDTRPVLILLRKFTNRLKWLKLTRNARQINGTMDLDFGDGFVSFADLRLTGDDVEILGWVDVRNREKTGRIYARHGQRAAGLALDAGEGKVVMITPRRWFDKQPGPPSIRGPEGALIGQ